MSHDADGNILITMIWLLPLGLLWLIVLLAGEAMRNRRMRGGRPASSDRRLSAPLLTTPPLAQGQCGAGNVVNVRQSVEVDEAQRNGGAHANDR